MFSLVSYYEIDWLKMILNAPTKPAVYRKFRKGHPEVWKHLFRRVVVGENSLTVDIGCGPGVEAEVFARIGAGIYLGIDHAIDAVVSASTALSQKTQIHFVCADSIHLPFENDIATIVTFMVSLHQMSDPVAVIKEAVRIVRPGGIVAVIGVPREQWIRACEFRFFPNLIKFELERRPLQSLDEIKKLVNGTLSNIHVKWVPYLTRPVDKTIVEAVMKRHFSALRLLDNAAFKHGLNELKNHIRMTKGQQIEKIDCFILSGRKVV
ncbi:MAG: class I SAM-dependent methyltransferase [Deltaproteobacteria bacterium]|nr:class I SAM-dependent methyltransferase [Deltaproteobacteria bacterium]